MTCGLLGVTADAAVVISVNLTYNDASNGNPSLNASDTTGVIPAANWNQVTAGNLGSSITPASGIALNYSTGANSGATFAHSSSGGAYVPRRSINKSSAFTNDEKLMAGYFQRYTLTSGSHSYTVTGLSDAVTQFGYNLYVYVGTPNVGVAHNEVGQYRVTSGSFDQTIWVVNGNVYTGNFVDGGTSSTLQTAGTGNYIVFSGLTESSFTLTGIHSADSRGSGINGFQIEGLSIPEPGTVVLMLMAFGLISITRKRLTK